MPACLTGVGSMFQSHLKPLPINNPREMLGQPAEALHDLQLYLRLNGVFIPWFHGAFLSAAMSDDDVEEVLRVHQVSVEAALKLHSMI